MFVKDSRLKSSICVNIKKKARYEDDLIVSVESLKVHCGI